MTIPDTWVLLKDDKVSLEIGYIELNNLSTTEQDETFGLYEHFKSATIVLDVDPRLVTDLHNPSNSRVIATKFDRLDVAEFVPLEIDGQKYDFAYRFFAFSIQESMRIPSWVLTVWIESDKIEPETYTGFVEVKFRKSEKREFEVYRLKIDSDKVASILGKVYFSEVFSLSSEPTSIGDGEFVSGLRPSRYFTMERCYPKHKVESISRPPGRSLVLDDLAEFFATLGNDIMTEERAKKKEKPPEILK